MDNKKFTSLLIKYIAKKMNLSEDQVYVVWLVKVLQNNKALASTTVDGDTTYIEVTYNGNKNEFYFDFYTKELNTVQTFV